MSSASHFDERSRRPRGKSRTNNFMQWSHGGTQTHEHTYGEGQGPGASNNMYSNYQQQPQYPQQQQYTPQAPQSHPYQPTQTHNYYQPQASPYAQYQQHQLYQPQGSSNYNQYPRQHMPKTNAPDINEMKSKIIQARVRNLALKRAIVQKSIQGESSVGQQFDSSIVRSLSASSSRGDVSVKSNATGGGEANPNAPFSDSISDLESQLEKLKKSQNKLPRSTSQHDDKIKSRIPPADLENASVEPSKNERRMSRRASSTVSEKKLPPEVPKLPIGIEDKDSEYDDKEQAQEVAEVDDRPRKKKNLKKRKPKVNTEREDRNAEALSKALDQILGEVDTEIETNQGILGEEKKVVSSRVEGGLHAPLDSYRMKELRRNEERKKRAEARLKIDSILKNENLEFKIPRWKHERNGNMNPKPEQVLKGKSLFRMAAYTVLYFYAKPMVRVRVMRIMGRDMLKEDLTKSTLLNLDTCSSWLTGAIKVPLTSIMQDQTLNFNGLQTKDFKGRKEFHQQCNLQMKVRVTAMVKGITSIAVDDIPPHIKSYLEKLVTDGNFFRTDFLYPFERASLEFDQLGATNNVTKSLSDEEVKEVKAILSERHDPLAPEGGDLVVVGENTYLITRAKMLIRNFLILRVLITNSMLSPWDHGLGLKPLPKQKRIVDNLRMASSMFYAMLKIYQPQMQHIVVGSRRRTIQRMKSGRFKSYGANRGTILAPDVPHPIINRTVTQPLENAKAENVDDESNAENVVNNDDTDVKPDNEKSDKKKYELPVWLSSFADKVLGEAQALNPEADDATSFLLQTRPPFDNDLEHLHVFLIGYDEELGHVKHLIDPWLTDLAKRLETWLDELTRHIVKMLKIKYQQEHNIQ